MKSDFNNYTPHITLGYVKPNIELPIKDGIEI